MTTPDPTATLDPGLHPPLERWLRSPWRRMLLILAGTLALAVVSNQIRYEELSLTGSGLSWMELFARRLVSWMPWALAAEPILWLMRLSTRLLRSKILLVGFHLALSWGAALGMSQLQHVLLTNQFGRTVTAESARPSAGRMGGSMRSGMRSRLGGSRMPGRYSGPQTRALSEPSPLGEARAARQRMSRNNPEAGVLLYFLILGFGWGMQGFFKRQDQERATSALALAAAKLEGELSQAQLSSLRNQLQPHFLFNALHSLGGLILQQRSDESLSVLSALGDLLRATLERGDDQESRLEHELALAESYLKVERARLGDRLQTTLQVEPGLAACALPTFVLLPLIENAVQYGIAPRSAGGEVCLSVKRLGDFIELRVSDDGSGFSQEFLDGSGSPSDEQHLGLANTRARLSALYGDQGELVCVNAPEGGALVILRIPYHERTDD